MSLAIGLMSGTSADGIDGVLAKVGSGKFEVLATANKSYSKAIVAAIDKLIEAKITKATESQGLDIELAHHYAEIAIELAQYVDTCEIVALGCHGQTINHQPSAMPPFSLQIGDGQTLANLTQLPVVCNFREADILAGGQGAPLTPGFHQYYFSTELENRLIVNIGGISNITYLPAKGVQQPLFGFDTGPGNTLLDQICREFFHQDYDAGGLLAQQGKIQNELFKQLLTDPYFSQPYPKSTGREYFNLSWLHQYIADKNYTKEDLLATLTALTAQTISMASHQLYDVKSIYVCGGGSKNLYLLELLRRYSGIKIETTERLGIDPQWVEAAAFAWMADNTIKNLPSSLASVTGAQYACVLGDTFWPVS